MIRVFQKCKILPPSDVQCLTYGAFFNPVRLDLLSRLPGLGRGSEAWMAKILVTINQLKSNFA